MTDRCSRWFPSEPKKWLHSDQTDLLYRDFCDRVVPYRSDPEPYTLRTEGIFHHSVDESLTLGDHEWKIDGFLRGVTTKMLTDHEVWIEVSFGDTGRNRAPFAVCKVDGVRLMDDGRLIQELPSPDELADWSWNRDEREQEVHLDTNRMVHAVLPDAYPTEVLSQVVHDLAKVASMADLATVMDPFESRRPGGSLFDVRKHIRTRDLAITQAALPIGWTAREIFRWPSRETNEYYYYWRELRFLHFRASLRSCAEDALRQVLALAGKQCGFVASVTAYGIHTPTEVQEFIHQFEAGDLAFSAVNDIILENVTAKHSKQRRVV